jgi:DNA-binding transcriptional LysR family regulator
MLLKIFLDGVHENIGVQHGVFALSSHEFRDRPGADMRLDYLESFYYAATIGDKAAVAKKRFLGEAAVDVQLRKLEEELGLARGVHLLSSRGRRYCLTTEGERFLPEAERMLGGWGKIKDMFRKAGQQRVSLRIGAIESVLHSWLIGWLEALRASHPELELELTIETTPALVDLLERGKLDVAVAAASARGSGTRSRQLTDMELVMVGSRSRHKGRSFRLKELAPAGLITFQRGSQPHAALLDALQRCGIEPAQVHAVSSISAMARMVARGLGVATLPRATLAELAEEPELRVLECDARLERLPVHVSWRPDPSSAVVDAVVEHAMRYCLAEPAERKRRPVRRQRSTAVRGG